MENKRNVWVLPTDKPSRLFEILQFNFVFDNQNMYTEKYKKLHKYKNQHISITNDEEIKEGDWFYDLDTKYVKIKQSWENSHLDFNGKKIILTTDQELIKDGIQAIDDDFLEWFVKNSSCEFVETKRLEDGQYFDYLEDNSVIEGIYENYKIIIPKEEPNPLTVGKEFYESADKNITVYRQETLEEAAERNCISITHPYCDREKEMFFKGVKWQQERMYSEEDLLSAFEAGMMFIGEDKGSFREWFEQFKKTNNGK